MRLELQPCVIVTTDEHESGDGEVSRTPEVLGPYASREEAAAVLERLLADQDECDDPELIPYDPEHTFIVSLDGMGDETLTVFSRGTLAA